MHFAIITRKLPPEICGIGDYCIHFSEMLRVAGHKVSLIAGRGNGAEDIHIIDDQWNETALARLYSRLHKINIDHVILEYTPLLFLIKGQSVQSRPLLNFWMECGQCWNTSLVLHETYFRTWWYPPCWIAGSQQKRQLKQLVKESHFVFSASQPLAEEIEGWRIDCKVNLLPIGSNFSVVPINREKMRKENGISGDDIVLTLFGGGNSLKWMSSYVNAVDSLLCKKGIRVHWLLLGGVSPLWFKLELAAIFPGQLPPKDISEWLQATDIFLMPHYAGLCAKRGTLMAAMQHGLPVVGTKTAMTDKSFAQIPGILLVPKTNSRFSSQVLDLCKSADLRVELGRSNVEYYERHLTWQEIVQTFIDSIR